MSCASVLIVEDDQPILASIQEILELEGYVVLTARDGREALQVLAESPKPALILIDLMMPIMNGQELIEHLGRDQVLATVPRVVLSAMVKPGEKLPGAHEVLRKPVDIDRLLKVVAAYCAPAST